MKKEVLLALHGGYRNLKSFQMAQLVFDITVRFSDRYLEKRSRTVDQMVQAARSGVQNIAEGSQASGTSKKTELKLTNVARASLEELKLDYEDFLRQRGLTMWPWDHPLRKSLINRRCTTADDVAQWIKEIYHTGQSGHTGHTGLTGQMPPKEMSSKSSMSSMSRLSSKSSKSMTAIYAELSANAALVLIAVACTLLSRQIAALAKSFETEGGFTERLYRVRSNNRRDDSQY